MCKIIRLYNVHTGCFKKKLLKKMTDFLTLRMLPVAVAFSPIGKNHLERVYILVGFILLSH